MSLSKHTKAELLEMLSTQGINAKIIYEESRKSNV